MANTIQTLLLLLAVMVAVAVIARRINVAPTILLVIAGIGLALSPGLPRIELAPELVLLVILPPLIYSAVVAVSTGAFSFWQAAGTFALIVVGEIAYGIAVGWLSLQLRRWVRDVRVEITLSLMTPYVAFLLPAHIGGSGVLATIAAGLFVS